MLRVQASRFGGPDSWGLDVKSLNVPGTYSFGFAIDGPQGHGEGKLPAIQVLAQPGPPLALSWLLCSLPVVGMIATRPSRAAWEKSVDGLPRFVLAVAAVVAALAQVPDAVVHVLDPLYLGVPRLALGAALLILAVTVLSRDGLVGYVATVVVCGVAVTWYLAVGSQTS